MRGGILHDFAFVERGVSLGSTLFATNPAILDTTSGSKLYLFKF